MRYFYIILLIAYLLKTIAGIPLLYYVYTTRETNVIPYSTLILMMTSGMLLLYTALSFNYYFHAFIYLVFFIVYFLIFVIKYYEENYDYFKEEATNDPLPQISNQFNSITQQMNQPMNQPITQVSNQMNIKSQNLR